MLQIRCGTIECMQVHDQLARMDAQQLREFAAGLIETLASKDRELRHKQLKIEQLTHEMAVLKRWKFAARSEQLHGVQRSLLDETIDADLEAIAAELATLRSPTPAPAPKEQPKRRPLPAHLPRVEVRHEPEQTVCRCGCALKRIGEDVSEKLDYTPGVFHVERHIRGKWACAKCQTLIQAPVPAQVIDKGVPTAGLLAQVLVAKYADHQPLYRQEGIFERAGVGHTALDAGAVGRCLRRAPAAAGRCAEGDAARASSSARRRDAGGDAQAGQGEARTGRTSGATARPNSMACTRSFTTSPTAAPRRTRRHFSTAGRVSSSATTTRGTRGCSLRE